jgi:hypothetical protein
MRHTEDQAYIQRLQQQYEVAPAKQHFNAVEHAHNVMESANSLSKRVHALVSRLMGPQPEEACSDSRPTYGPGIFPNLHDVSDETGLAIRKANEALDRLEKELA